MDHTDQCLEDVRRVGFCEHELISQGRRIRRETPNQRFRRRHPWRYELLTTGGFAAVVVAFVVMIQQLGPWLALGITLGQTLGMLVILLFGPPTWFTMDPREIIPRSHQNRDWEDR